MLNLDLATSGALAIPLIIAIIQALKMVGLKSKHAPLVSIGLGVLISFLIEYGSPLVIGETILAGIVFGLSASGLYSGTLTTKEAIEENTTRPK